METNPEMAASTSASAISSQPPEKDQIRSDTESSPDNNNKVPPFQRNVPERQSKGRIFVKPKPEAEYFLDDSLNPTFEQLHECAFADKTMFLKKFLQKEKVYRFTLPRRMGKTLLLKMVESFCDVAPKVGIPTQSNGEKKIEIWEGTEIKTREANFFDDHFGRHPTIFITLHDVFGETFDTVLNKFRMQFRITCLKFDYIYEHLKNNEGQALKFHLNFLEKALNADKSLGKDDLSGSLQTLAEIVKAFHGGSKIVLLMDEYDKPISSLFTRNMDEKEIESITSFHSALMVSTFKSNPFVSHAIAAGILRTGSTEQQSGLSFSECNLLLGTDLNEFVGFSREDIEEMALEIHTKCGFEIPENIIQILWSWCNGYSYTVNGFQYNFCNPYACCKFLNHYIKYRNDIFLPDLLRIHLNIDSLVDNLRRLLQKKEIAELLMNILLNYSEEDKEVGKIKQNLRKWNPFGKKMTIKQQYKRTTILNDEFFLQHYKEFNEAMNRRPFKMEDKFVSTFLTYLFQVGILTKRGDFLAVPNQQIRNRLHDLLFPYYVQIFQFSEDLANEVTTALQQIAFTDGFDQKEFRNPMKKFKQTFTTFLKATNFQPGAEFFPHAMFASLSAKIKNKIYFIPDEKYECLDGEILYIDLTFTLAHPNNNKMLTTVIVEMKYNRNADVAVKEAIYYRKVFDDIIARGQQSKFDRFIYVGINVPKSFRRKGLTMCYRIEDGTVDQLELFITPDKMKENESHKKIGSRLDTIKPEKGVHYFEVV